MIKFPKIILFCLIICAAFSGCSKTSITNNSVPEVQNEPVIKPSKFVFTEVSVVRLDEVSLP